MTLMKCLIDRGEDEPREEEKAKPKSTLIACHVRPYKVGVGEEGRDETDGCPPRAGCRVQVPVPSPLSILQVEMKLVPSIGPSPICYTWSLDILGVAKQNSRALRVGFRGNVTALVH